MEVKQGKDATFSFGKACFVAITPIILMSLKFFCNTTSDGPGPTVLIDLAHEEPTRENGDGRCCTSLQETITTNDALSRTSRVELSIPGEGFLRFFPCQQKALRTCARLY